MLIRNNTLTESANSILENATYLYESEMPNVSAYSIPVVANDRFNAGIVSYDNLSHFCENYGLDIIDGISAVAEANNIDPNDVVVSIDESTIISDPWVIDEVHQYVVAPVSESNLVSQFTDAMVSAWLESGDDYYLQAIGEPELVLEAGDDKGPAYADGNFVSSQQLKDYYSKAGKAMSDFGKQSTEVGGEKIKPDDPNFLVKIKRFLTDKPREYLSRAVARLRQTYRKFLLRADKENDENKIKWYKQIARKILQAVDWVLSKIQKAATVKYGGRLSKAKAAYADKLKNASKGKAGTTTGDASSDGSSEKVNKGGADTSYLHTYNPDSGNFESKAGTTGGTPRVNSKKKIKKDDPFGNPRAYAFGV